MNYAERRMLDYTINIAALFPGSYLAYVSVVSFIYSRLQLIAHHGEKLVDMKSTEQLQETTFLKEAFLQWAAYANYDIAFTLTGLLTTMIFGFFISFLFLGQSYQSIDGKKRLLKAKIFVVSTVSLFSVFNTPYLILNFTLEDNIRRTAYLRRNLHEEILQYMNTDITHWWGSLALVAGLGIPIAIIVFLISHKYDTK